VVGSSAEPVAETRPLFRTVAGMYHQVTGSTGPTCSFLTVAQIYVTLRPPLVERPKYDVGYCGAPPSPGEVSGECRAARSSPRTAHIQEACLPLCRIPTPGARVRPNARAPIRVFSQLSVISRGRINKRGNRWEEIIYTHQEFPLSHSRDWYYYRAVATLHPPYSPPSLDSLTARNAGIHRGIQQFVPVETLSV
jgi:hypothetical protein